MKRRSLNPVHEAALFALSTAVGIVVGSVATALILERLQASKQLPPASPPNFVPGA